MTAFLIALQFLTTLPINIASRIEEESYGEAVVYFPLAGFVIGLCLAMIAVVFGFLPDLVKGVFILVGSVVLTGAIHLDGFADTCDGFYGGRSKEKILKIMHDSRIGVMGTIGIICLLFFKFVLIVSIPAALLWKALIVITVISRWCVAYGCYASGCARPVSKAKFFIKYADKKKIIIGGFFTLGLCVLWAGVKGIFVFISVFICVYAAMRYILKKIGGMTGDTLGAINEIAEAAGLFAAFLYF